MGNVIDEVKGKSLSKCTKAELIELVQSLYSLNEELSKNNDEMRELLHSHNDRETIFIQRVEELKNVNNNLWLVIRKGLGLKEILDDAEDIADDIKGILKRINVEV